MRTFLVALVIVLAAASTGCASTSNSVSPSSKRLAESNYRYESNRAYIARVEAIAAQRGVAVEWVNPPLVRVAKQTPVRSDRDY